MISLKDKLDRLEGIGNCNEFLAILDCKCEVKEAVLDFEEFEYYSSIYKSESSYDVNDFEINEKYFLNKYGISIKYSSLSLAIYKIFGDFEK